MNYNYLLKELKKVNKKVNKVFYYLVVLNMMTDN